jgi:hypothetical protein
MATSITQTKAKVYPLWISDSWYILLDEKGRCKEHCAEGALGFIIQLQSAVNAGHHMALKIPRLMGETRRENAYINQLAEKELKSVQDIFHTLGEKSCLLTAHVESGSLLRRPVAIKSGSGEAQQWDGALIFVSFEKGENPTFCLMKKSDDKKLQHYPPDTKNYPNIDATAYEQIREKAKGKLGNPWECAVFVDGGEGQEGGNGRNANILSAEEAFSKDESVGRTWYACLPSIMYHWAPVTLQESISKNARNGPWDKGKHLTLIERVCQGLVTLHRRGMLHADVRPANMVYEGAADDPDSYYLSDYGSFSDPGAPASGGVSSSHNPEGTTVLGPVVTGERISAFYAPERRHSRERESANTAVIHNPIPGGGLYIILGWSSELIDEKTKRPSEELEELVNPDNLKKYAKGSNLVRGDRIQLREYIFEVEKEWHVGNKQVLECNSRYWKIYHGRIVVECVDPFDVWDFFPIARTIELKQWSAATDLYSLGAMALYSVFYDSVYKQHEKGAESSDGKSAGADKSDSHGRLEDDFREMLNYLESRSYFNAIWPELEWMRTTLEKHLENVSLTEATLASQQFTRYPSEEKLRETQEKDEKELKGAVIALVGRITQSVPKAREIVEALDYDLGTFIFFIHFVLCCLHRREDVEVDKSWTWMNLEANGPFARNRLEQPGPGGAAVKALERIKKVRKIVDDRLLGGLKLKASNDPNDKENPIDKIPDFDPRPTSAIRVELNQTKVELDETKANLDETKTSLQTYEKAVEHALEIAKSKLAFSKINELREALQRAMETNKPA